jgi:hypothetical protein
MGGEQMSLLRLEMRKKLEKQIIERRESPKVRRTQNVVSAIDYTPGIRVSLNNQSRNFGKLDESRSVPTRVAMSTMTEALAKQKYAEAYSNP